MNDIGNAANSGILKNFYGKKKPPGPIAQMNNQMPMMDALRAKRDALKCK